MSPAQASKVLQRLCMACVWTLAVSVCTLADFVVYRLPGTEVTVLLEGKTKGVGQGVFEYTHPSLGTLTFSHQSALIIKAPTKTEEYRRLFGQARQEQSFDGYIQAARFAIRSGMLDANPIIRPSQDCSKLESGSSNHWTNGINARRSYASPFL
ncbi:MAG: hypothetical protein LW850_06750 [Planctomycetaceae bacterium]|nr:hypothetical protein [Planctomycetaceae bacterium]